MKKFILPAILFFLLFLPRNVVNAQIELDCRKAYDQEDYKCLGVFNKCNNSCVDSAYAGQSLTVDGSKLYKDCIAANDCHGKSAACSKDAQANYKVCLKSDKQPVASEAKQETPKQDQGSQQSKQPVFTSEWFSYAVDGLMALPDVFYDTAYEDAANLVSEDSKMTLDTLIQKRDVPDVYVDRYTAIPVGSEKLDDTTMFLAPGAKPYNVKINKGGQYIILKSEEEIPDGSTIVVQQPEFFIVGDRVFEVRPLAGHTEAVFNISKNAKRGEVRIEPFFESGVIEVWPKVEAKKESSQEFFINILTPEVKATPKKTHYSVSRVQGDKITLVVVYEGKVEVKTKNGEIRTVIPDGDKPGVVVVSQKLSVAKLAITGFVLLVILGGIVWFIKRKTSTKYFKKRSK